MREFTGKVAVITGGANGIGRAMGQRFAEEGMKVVLADVQAEPLSATVEAFRNAGHEVTGIVTDVSKLASMQALAAETIELFGVPNIVCLNAGIGSGAEGAMWEHEENDWRWCMDVNVYGVINGITAFVGAMVDSGEPGHVVTTSSPNGGVVPFGYTAPYALTKGAVVSLTESLYAQLLQRTTKVKASVLFPGPGWLQTNLWEYWRSRPDEYAKANARQTPYPSLDDLVAMTEQAGGTVEFTPLEDVAAQVVEAIVEERFWILPHSSGTDESMAKRATSMANRTNPDYFRDWRPKTDTE